MSQGDIVIDGRKQDGGAPAKARGAKGNADDKVTIMIPKTKEDTRDVFVSVNFVPYQIQRGVPVAVPPEVVHALEIARETTMVPEEDPLTRRITLRSQETQSVPFQYVR